MVKLSKCLDCIGILHLKEKLTSVENFITKTQSWYLSRNKVYYESKSLHEISSLRERLLTYLGEDKLTNYVVLDYSINFSAQVYYNLLSKNQTLSSIKQAMLCLEEDANNMVRLIENKNNFTITQSLPKSNLLINIRNIELDNKLEVYSYVKNFGKTDYTIVTPGLGSILIGPFFKAIWKNEYKNILYSRFKKQDNLISKKFGTLNKKLYLIDDNIGSGFTTEELMEFLKENKLYGTSSVEYDWFLYDIISKGQSTYTKFNYDKYDKLTILNTRNHRFLDQSISYLVNEPNKYISYLKENNFFSYFKNDLSVMLKIGKNITRKYLPKQKYNKALCLSKKIIKTYKGV